MKKKASTSKKATRHGQIRDDWTKIGIQLPKEMADDLRDAASSMGHGGVKLMATAAFSILLSLDEDSLQTVCSYVRQKTWDTSDGLKRERVLELVKVMITENDGDVPIVEPIWFVDKILDPELTPPPGKKLSDKKRRKGRDEIA
ncbi:hypothetical protein COB72_03380 [bacterium]|nr:MAG: hypothetical protein COB72_03380 [bacterium]